MRRTPSLALLLLAALVLPGCLSPSATETGELERLQAGEVPLLEVVVVSVDGRTLTADAFPGELPRLTQVLIPGTAFEPTVGVDGDGGIFYAASGAVTAAGPLRLPRSDVLRSLDGGATWESVDPAASGPGGPALTFDPYVHVDPRSGRVFSLDLYLGCHHLAWSDDQGRTWANNPFACGTAMNDHQTIFTGPPPAGTLTVGYPSIVHVCSNQWRVALTIMCTRSLDGGRSFGPAVPLAVEPEGDDRFERKGACGALGHGPGRVSPADGTVYLPRVYCDEMRMHVSRDGGLTWSEVVVDTTVGGSPDPIDNHEGTVAVDAAGNVYAYWIAADLVPRLSVSRDQGRTWSAPLSVGVPGLVAARFPAIVAGDEGRVAFLYYGTRDGEEWHAHVGFILDALDPAPVIATVLANPVDDPVRRGSCEARCHGVGDFLDIALDPATGNVVVALVDVCTPDEGCAPAADASHGRAAIALQVGGASLRRA